jgi:hypothetical protein
MITSVLVVSKQTMVGCENFSSSCQSANNGLSVITSVLVVSQHTMIEV